jgi:hypothetical protein
VTRVAGALLLVELLGRTSDLAAGLRRLRSRAAARQLGFDDLVEEVLFDLSAEDLIAQIDFAGLLTLEIEDVELHGFT